MQRVESTEEMMKACLEVYPSVDAVIKAAAVADYKPHHMAEQKIKKNDEKLTLELDKTPDILKRLGQEKKHQFLVGFAAETQNLVKNAAEKVKKKNLDMIVANDVTMAGCRFQYRYQRSEVPLPRWYRTEYRHDVERRHRKSDP
jgi:phosphopantothenoylcysteine decarboxylase/phosphopantothenate--cysteine ligase